MIAEFAVQALKTNIFQFNVFATQFSRAFLLEFWAIYFHQLLN